MTPDNPTSDGPDHAVRTAYEPVVLVKAGDIVTLTNGSSFSDTADRRVYYY
ncbi:hypothetical protein [Nocardioides speluncae]|uniref:hypothetical protein n=1 Tax=Nocardioides speluncae TaxID=2670337 RepID=UPI0012B16650|nr:hypothetical protein [Nocardioides speluncae]